MAHNYLEFIGSFGFYFDQDGFVDYEIATAFIFNLICNEFISAVF